MVTMNTADVRHESRRAIDIATCKKANLLHYLSRVYFGGAREGGE